MLVATSRQNCPPLLVIKFAGPLQLLAWCTSILMQAHILAHLTIKVRFYKCFFTYKHKSIREIWSSIIPLYLSTIRKNLNLHPQYSARFGILKTSSHIDQIQITILVKPSIILVNFLLCTYTSSSRVTGYSLLYESIKQTSDNIFPTILYIQELSEK